MTPVVKICCIQDPGEASLAVRYGAWAVGLVGPMPSGPGVISLERARRIAGKLPPAVLSVLLTSERRPERIAAEQRHTGARALQLVDAVDAEAYRVLRETLPGVMLMQVIHVRGERALREALAAAPLADALLLDSGNPEAATKVLGGTGRVHDWGVSLRIVERAERPVLLAGGLRPDNVAQGVAAVRPFGVDVCTGVRTEGRLDEAKLAAFMSAVQGAAHR